VHTKLKCKEYKIIIEKDYLVKKIKGLVVADVVNTHVLCLLWNVIDQNFFGM
jgi:hypothetical protein